MKIHIVKNSFAGKVLHAEHFIRDRDLFLGILVFNLAPHHQFDDRFFVDAGRFMRFDHIAIPQDGDIVRDFKNLIHFVRDIDDARAALFELLDLFKQPLHLFGGDRRGRLVHDDDVCVEGNRFEDFDHLDVRNVKAAQLGIRRIGEPLLL